MPLALPPPETPVTLECLQDSARATGVPLALVGAVLMTEGGRVGGKDRTGPGRYDYGPMQINTLSLPDLAPLAVTPRTLRNDGCVNVLAGAWLLSTRMQGNEPGYGVGRYHSGTPSRNLAYRARIALALRAIRDGGMRPILKAIRRANTPQSEH